MFSNAKCLWFVLSVLMSALIVIGFDWFQPSDAQVSCAVVQVQTQDQCDAASAFLAVVNSKGDPVQTTITPVVTADGYALLGWSTENTGGQAILKQTAGVWQVVRGVGGAFGSAANLLQFGVPPQTAQRLWDLWSQANVPPVADPTP